MRFLAWLYAFGMEIIKLSVTAAAALLLVCLVLTSGWHYALVNGVEKRCWSVCLPGYLEYTDWDHGDLAVRRVFTMRARYRLGPWIDPEWIEHPEETSPLPYEAEE